MSSANDSTRRHSIELIESKIADVLSGLAAGEHTLSLQLGPRTTLPGRSVEEARRVDVMLCILSIIHRALVDNVVITKRDIFYRNPELFSSQQVVDRAVESIARNFSIARIALNVTATAKGLVIGDFSWTDKRGQARSGLENPSGTLISEGLLDSIIDLGTIAWILVVEKDATFKTLVSANLHACPTLLPGMIITGKGYPDIATRAFLHRACMSHRWRSCPPLVLGLVDNDPDGLSILSTYKYGSASQQQLQGRDAEIPRMQWLGVRMCHTVGRGDQEQSLARGDGGFLHGLLQMTARDRSKAASILANRTCTESGPELEWRRELQIMLMTNCKTEIQILEQWPGGTVGWLARRLPFRLL